MSIYPPFVADQGRTPFLFVSYAHKDKAQVYPLINQLHDAGIPIWYDEGIPPSTKWLETIASKIDTCACFLVFLSNNAVQSENVKNEIIYALERFHKKEIKFLPVYLCPTNLSSELKLSIGRIQALLQFELPQDAFYTKLWDEVAPLQRKTVESPPLKIRKAEVEPALIPVERPTPSLLQESKTDKEILKELEELIGKSIPSTATMEWNTVGVKFEGDAIVRLGLYQCGLTALPESFGALKSLQTLYINNNPLRTLQESFGQLQSLQKLEIYNNQLTTLPESFGELKSLQTLLIYGNKLTTLPESFGGLISLQTLDLGYNQLTTLPDSFTQLLNLQTLLIQDNPLNDRGKKSWTN